MYCGKAERQNFFEFQPYNNGHFFSFCGSAAAAMMVLLKFLVYISSIPISLKLPPQNRTYVMRETNYVWVYILIGESFFGIVV